METVIDFLGTLLAIFIIALVIAIPTWALWNDVMPEVFGLHRVTFWQALELNLLFGLMIRAGEKSK